MCTISNLVEKYKKLRLIIIILGPGFFPTYHFMCLNLNVFSMGKLVLSSTIPYCLEIRTSLVAQTVKNLSVM